MKNIQISEELFFALLKYHLVETDDVLPEIKKGLEDKLEAMVRRDLYTKYKTAPTEEEREKARQEYLEKVGMAPYINAKPRQLSGGQKQRIAIAGIVAMKPKCIVLDEPTAMLDPHGRKDVINVLHELNRREGVTIILITHYMDEVIDADKVFVMDDGKLVMQGKPREIFSQVDRLKELRLDVPQVTELAYELKKSGLDMPDGILTHEEFRDALKKCMADAGAPKNGGAR